MRAFLDHLERRPELAQWSVRSMPPTSGSAFIDNLLAGIAEEIADDRSVARPAWTTSVSPLEQTWESVGTPRMRGAAAAGTPPQFALRNVLIPTTSLWRPSN